MIQSALSLFLAYLIGSIPTSFIFTKILRRIDIRQHGSGNVGATNVFRVVGKLPAIAVLLLDVAKGAVCVIVLSNIFYSDFTEAHLGMETYRILLGACGICGHIWSVFLRFSGGKGVATTAGVLVALAPGVFFASVFVWIVIFAIFRIVSAASVAAAVLLPVLAIVFNRSLGFVIFAALICIMGTYKHKANIGRLLQGEEKKLF
jgi:glycerol-3-phosphate acyltransferase PlsY